MKFKQTLFPVLVLIGLIGFVNAWSLNGFYGSNLSSTPSGVYFNGTNLQINASTYYNGNLVPFNKYQCQATFQGDFDWSCYINVTQGQLNNAKNFSFVFASPETITDDGDNSSFSQLWSYNNCGVSQFYSSVCATEVINNFADLIGGLESQYNFVVNTSTIQFNGQNAYQILVTNISSLTPASNWSDGTLYIQFGDPQISTFSAPSFGLGAFNNSYVNYSSSVYQTWYPNNNSFAPNGVYYSQPLILNHTFPANITGINWSWFEGSELYGNGSDQILTSLNLENDTKDASHFNNSAKWIGTGYTFNPNCYSGGCFAFNQTGQSGLNISNFANRVGLSRPINFTVVFWLNASNVSGVNYNESIADATFACNGNGYNTSWFSLNTSGDLMFSAHKNSNPCTGGGGFVNIFGSNAPIYNNTWYMVAITMNMSFNLGTLSQTESLYLNGTLNSTSSWGNPAGGYSIPWLFGVNTTGGAGFNGEIDNIQIWNQTLSAANITTLFNWEKTGGFIHNFTNVTMQVRTKNYTLNDTNLIGWWDLGDSNDNETVTNVSLDLSGNGNNAFFNNASQNTINNTACVVDDCLNLVALNNAHDGLTVYNPNLNLVNFSYFTWINIYGNNVKGPNNRIAEYFNGTAIAGWQMAIVNGSWGYNLEVIVRNVTSSTVINGTGMGLQNNTWYLVGFTFNNLTSNVTVYINGSQVNSTIQGFQNPTHSEDNLVIGATGQTQSQGMNGSIDATYLWNRTISGSEVSNLYNNGCPTCNGNETNWTEWTTPSNFTGTAIFNGIYGNIVQYRALLNSSNTNLSAFLSNATIVYSNFILPPSGRLLLVNLNWPYNNSVQANFTINFNYTPNDSQFSSFVNATLFSNFSGTWVANNTNQSLVKNGSINNITVGGLPVGTYVWNVQVCDINGCNMSSVNYTVQVISQNNICTISNTSSIWLNLHFDNNILDYGLGNLNTSAIDTLGALVYGGTGYTLPLEYGTGQVNQALNFTDTNDGEANGPIIAIQNGAAFTGANYTVTMWLKFQNYGQNYSSLGLFGNDPDFTNAQGQVLFDGGNNYGTGTDNFVINDGGGANQDWFKLFTKVPDGNFHQLIVVFNSTGVVSYWDGQLMNYTTNAFVNGQTGKAISPLTAPKGLSIGGCANCGNPFEGFMDEVHFFNRTFAQSDVTNLFTQENAGNSTPATCVVLPYVQVSLISPLNNSQQFGINGINFSYVPNDSDNSYGNATLYANFSGSWAAIQMNASNIINGSINWINVTSINAGSYVWNVLVCDAHLCSFAPLNYTLTVLAPTSTIQLISPTNGQTFSNNPLVLNFSFIPSDTDNSWLGCNLTANFSGGFGSNWNFAASNSSKIINGSVNWINVTAPQMGVYLWNIQCQDTHSFISGTSNFTFSTIPASNAALIYLNEPITQDTGLIIALLMLAAGAFIKLLSWKRKKKEV